MEVTKQNKAPQKIAVQKVVEMGLVYLHYPLR